MDIGITGLDVVRETSDESEIEVAMVSHASGMSTFFLLEKLPLREVFELAKCVLFVFFVEYFDTLFPAPVAPSLPPPLDICVNSQLREL